MLEAALINSFSLAILFTIGLFTFYNRLLKVKDYILFFGLLFLIVFIRVFFNIRPVIIIFIVAPSIFLRWITGRKESSTLFFILYIIIGLSVLLSSAIAAPYARHTSDPSTFELTSAIKLIVTAAILYVPIILVLKHLYQKYLVVIFDQINEKLFLFITLLLAFCAFFIYGVMTLAAGIEEDRYYPLVGLITLYMVLTIGSVTIILIYTKKNFEQQQKIKDLNTLKEYTDTLEATYNNLRSFKHDYVNILSTLAVFIDEKRYDELDTFFHQNIMPLTRDLTQNNASLANLSRIKNLELKSIFYSKLLLANSKNIEITVDIPDEIEKPNVDAIDLSRILGIYLDNAIEAALETDHPILNLHSCAIDNGIVFIISNSFIDHGISVSQMYKKGISSKGEGRGLGLYNVAAILAKYDNIFTETSMEKGLFTQKLQIISR